MTHPTFGTLSLGLIAPSTTNPRKHFDEAALHELADSIKASGVHQPVLVRPLPAHRLQDTFTGRQPGAPLPEYELVAGERRYRASVLAKAESIPAMIRELTDDQVLEIQIVENLQRLDLTALEEAQGYQALMGHSGINADQVAAKIGKSRSYVFGRMKLLDLGQDGQDALRQGLIDASKALLLARIPSTALQAKALKEIIRPNHPEGIMSHRSAAEWIRSRYMLKLEQAPFDHTDGSLAPRACTVCPTRTGADADIFADVMGPDMCTDPECYNNKVQQHHSRRRAQLEAQGHQVIDGKDAEALLPTAFSAPEGYARLDDVADSPTSKPLREELAKLIDKGEIKPVMIANPHRDGELIACVPEDAVPQLLQRAGRKKAAEAAQAEEERRTAKDEDKRAKELRAEFEATWRKRTLSEVCACILAEPTEALDVGVMVCLGNMLVDQIGPDIQACLGELLELKADPDAGYPFEAALRAWLKDPRPEFSRADALTLLTAAHGANCSSWMEHPARADSAEEQLAPLKMVALLEAIDIERVKADVQAEITERETAAKPAEPASTDGPAAQASEVRRGAQAEGEGSAAKGRKGAKGPGREGPAGAPRAKPRLSAQEAQLGIAAAMQGLGEEGIGDCADAKPGADAHGNEALPLASEAQAQEEAQAGQVQGTEAPTTTEAAQAAGHQVDELYAQAVEVVRTHKKASISLVQRHLSIGYNRAARLLEAMEAQGIVSPMQPDGTRNLLKKASVIKRSDVLLEDAVDLVKEEQACSVRLIKERLGVGTARALRIISQLEYDGVVSACDERGARKVLVQA